VDFTTLSLADVKSGLDEVARDTQVTFGGLDARQLTWRPDAVRWSVAQCFERGRQAPRQGVLLATRRRARPNYEH
jgi:hypothetical protein